MNRQYKALSMSSPLNTLAWTPRDINGNRLREPDRLAPRDDQGRRVRTAQGGMVPDRRGRPVRVVVVRDEHEPWLAGVRERAVVAEASRTARTKAREARRAERARR